MMNENPYNPLQPLGDPHFFYGRSAALAFLHLHLSGRVNEQALVLLGPPGMGKSTLLGQIPLVVDERYPGINVNVEAIDLTDPVALMAAIVDQSRAMMTAIQASTYRLPPFPDPTDPTTDLFAWLADDYLDVVLSAIRRQRHLVVMLDNVHLLLDAIDAGHFPASFWDYWQGLLRRYEQLDLLVTFDITYEERALQVPLFADVTTHFRLTNLDLEAARRVITEPASDKYTLSPAAVERVLDLAGGHPFHLHSVCRLIYRRWSEARHVDEMTVADVEAVYPAALEMASQTIDKLWTRLRPNERLGLTALMDLREQEGATASSLEAIRDWLSATDFPLDEVQLAAAFRGLEYWGIVHSDDLGRYYFASAIQADWLARHRTASNGQMATELSSAHFSVTALIAIGVLVLVLIGALLLFSGDDERPPVEGGPATVTLEVPPTSTTVPQPFLFGG